MNLDGTHNKSFYNTRLNIYFITKGILNSTNKIKFDMNMIDKNYNKNNFHLIKNAIIEENINNLNYDLNKIFTSDTYFEDFKKYFLESNIDDDEKEYFKNKKIIEKNIQPGFEQMANKLIILQNKLFQEMIKKYENFINKRNDYFNYKKKYKNDIETGKNKNEELLKYSKQLQELYKDELKEKVKYENIDKNDEFQKNIIMKNIEIMINRKNEIEKRIESIEEKTKNYNDYVKKQEMYNNAKKDYLYSNKYINQFVENMKKNINYMLTLFFKTGQIITFDNKRYKIVGYKLIHKEAYVYYDRDEYIHIYKKIGLNDDQIEILNKQELKEKHDFIDEDFYNKEKDNKDVNSYNITIQLDIVNENETSYYFQKNNCSNKKIEIKNAFQNFVNNVVQNKIDLLTLEEKKILNDKRQEIIENKRFNYYKRRVIKEDNVIEGGFIQRHSNKNKNKNKSSKKNNRITITSKTKKKRE